MRQPFAISLIGSVIGLCFLAQPALAVVSAENSFNCAERLPTSQKRGLLESIERRYQQVEDLTSDFVQETFSATLERPLDQDSGELSFKKPGMMDWRYLAPKTQRWISDGKTLWFYQPDLNQVIVGDFQLAFQSDTPVSFLLGVGKLHETFELVDACRSDAGIVVELKPKREDPSLREFSLLVNGKDFTPLGAKMTDAAGNPTSIKLTNLKINSRLTPGQFVFEIPKGTDTIDNRGAALDHHGAPLNEKELIGQ